MRRQFSVSAAAYRDLVAQAEQRGMSLSKLVEQLVLAATTNAR